MNSLIKPSPSAYARRAVLVVAAACCLGPASAAACNVPVFRYALERWPPDPYLLTVFHGDEGPEALEAIADAIAERRLNLRMEVVAFSEVEEDGWRLSGVEIDPAELPWAVLRYPPRGAGAPAVAWSGRFDGEALVRLADSPVRQEIARRLVSGESAVWVLVESGDAEKDAAARTALERDLAVAERELRIPTADELDYSPADGTPPVLTQEWFTDPAVEVPLKVEFSLLALARDDAEEAGLLAALLHSEPDLGEYADEPMVFPVFGQGRALWALVGRGINTDNILEACLFLTGPCSCQVKHLNPGTDLLLDFDWWAALEGRLPPPPSVNPELLTAVVPRLDDDAPPEPAAQAETSPRDEGAAAPPAVPETRDDVARAEAAVAGGRVFVVTGAVLGGLLALVAAATVVLVARRNE